MAGHKLRINGWAKAENTSGDHILNHHMVRPPKAAAPCGEGRPKAARQYVVSACIFSFCPALFFQLLPSHVFSAFAQISISGQLGATNSCIFSFPVNSFSSGCQMSRPASCPHVLAFRPPLQAAAENTTMIWRTTQAVLQDS